MRPQFLALTFLATAMATSVLAQQAAAPATTFMNNKEIMGLIDKAKADRKGEAPLVSESILSLAPYRAQLEYRPGISPAANSLAGAARAASSARWARRRSE